MKMIRLVMLAVVVTLLGVAQTSPVLKKQVASGRENLIGAWRLASIGGPDGNPVPTNAQPSGILIYTRDGHMSVQLMYPRSAKALSNEYVENGYEASFGSYSVDETNHTVTHHVEGSNTGDRLIGKDLRRVYGFTASGQLIIRPARADEHWSVTWEHY